MMKIFKDSMAWMLNVIADKYGFDKRDFIPLASEDPFPNMGWDLGEGDAPVGSLWSVEGRILYALIRAAKPTSVIELGTHAGASTVHIASALDANGSGKLTSVDNRSHPDPVKIGELVPDELRKLVTFKDADGIEYLKTRRRVDFIFEDMLHSSEQVEAIANLAKEKLSVGGFLVVHDAAHFIVGSNIQAGLEAAGLEPLIVLPEPSDCGLAIWRKS